MPTVDKIVSVALRECDGPVPELASYTAAINSALKSPNEIPTFSRTSRPLDLVRFRCLLQDTGYPAEVYLPEEQEDNGKVDWSKLKERWVGWGVEIPGEQAWADPKSSSSSNDVADALSSLSLSELPLPVKGKFPIPSQENYTGALLKVYDSDASFRPASAYDVVGIVSTAPLPSPFAEGEEGEDELVPAIHVLVPPTPAFPPSPAPVDVEAVRAELVSHLAHVFSPPDAVAAEVLLLSLLAYPASRPGGMPLGTLSLNLIRPASKSDLASVLGSITPAVVPLVLTIPLLHSATFRPSSDGSSLSPGFLQLASGTVLAIDEDGLGAGGTLQEKALRNIQSLSDAISDQSLRYDYPYTDGVRIECAVRSVITSEGKSLLPADLHIPVTLAENTPPATNEALAKFRAYLSHVSSSTNAEKLTVPANVGETIQNAFVEDRRASGSGSAEAAEGRLRRRMKIARLMATSYPAAELTNELWARTVAIDEEIEGRLKAREDMRREGKIGAPTADKPKANGSATKTAISGTVEEADVVLE